MIALLVAALLVTPVVAAPSLPPELRELVELARTLHESLGAPQVAPIVDGPDGPPGWTEDALSVAMLRSREARSETTLTAARSTTLEVSTLAGAIAVQAWNRNDVRVIAHHGRRDRLQSRLESGTLHVAVVGRAGEPAFGDVTVLVPAWMPMRLSSVESPIEVGGSRATVEAGSIRGDVVVHQVAGAVRLRSVEGRVWVLDVRGPVQAASLNNLVRLERVVGGIDAESVNGDIQISDVDSPDVDASSVNGSVLFLGPFQPGGRYRLASHSGNLQVGVPVGADVDVSVRNFRGAFRNGLPVLVAPHGAGRPFTFTLGGGGSSLELQSFQGFIQLLRSSELLLPRTPQQAEDR